MSDQLPGDDNDLLDRLRVAAARYDAVPRRVIDGAKAAFDLRRLDDELAALSYDTVRDSSLVGVRGETPRQLTYTAGDLGIDVDIDAWGLVGHVSSGIARDVEVQTPATSSWCVVDDLGRFFGETPPSGPFRLRLHVGTSHYVVTEWVNR